MMQGVQVELNPDCHDKRAFDKGTLTQANWVLNFKEETYAVLHMEHSFVWCWKLDASESRLEISENFNLMQEKNGKGQFEWSCEKWRNIFFYFIHTHTHIYI